MAAERRGALIVFERSVGLRNYVDQGIPLDARITYDLLFSIFHTETPLHDGAVIIQSDRMAAASCFLPLTTNPRLARDLGSRHRAAIGISEETDAVALVVSEETGTISLAVNGRVTRRLDAATLRIRLAELLTVEEREDTEAVETVAEPSGRPAAGVAE
jgi:diadenylate cyclase